MCSLTDIDALVRDAINRGAWSIEVYLEGRYAVITDDSPASFDDFVGSAISAPMNIELHDGESRRSMKVIDGRGVAEARDHGGSEWIGSRISLRTAVAPSPIERDQLRECLGTLCALHPSLAIILDGDDLSQPRGLAGEVARVINGTALHARPLRFAGNRHDVQVDVALQWGQSGAPSVRCFDAEEPRELDEPFWLGVLDAAYRTGINERVVEEMLRPGLVALVAIVRQNQLAIDDADLADAVRVVTREGLSAHKRVLDKIIAIRSRSQLAG